jgi:hypothetical protein
MPISLISRKFLFASLIYFILGLLAQTVNVFDVWLGFNPLAYTAVTATTQLLLIGWLTQLGLALVYDRWPGPVAQNNMPAGRTKREKWPMVVFILFNLGLPPAILGQPGLMIFGGPWFGAVAAFGALLQLFAGFVFVYDLYRGLLAKR